MTVNPPQRPRRYHSPQRQEQASATRRRLLDVAARLFAERGYAATTMQAVAAEAEVALATVYLHFAGRAALVAALAEEVVAAPDLSVEQMEQELDPLTQLRLGASIIRRLNERSWVLVDILRSQRGRDDELTQLWVRWQERHLEAVRRGVAALAERGGLRAGLSVVEATDILYAVAGTEVYRALVYERGWSPARYEAWLLALACREVLAERGSADC
jgi:AcrR family transcriptional regulator